MQTLTLILSIWAAITGTISFVILIIKSRKEIKGRLKVNAHLAETKEKIIVEATNVSFRPVTITSLHILYGSAIDYYQTVLINNLPHPRQAITEAIQSTFEIPVEEIRQWATINKITQRYYHMLFVKVLTSSSGNFIAKIDLPANYFADKNYYTAHDFMVSDDLMGFPLMEPRYPGIAMKSLIK